MSMGESRTTVNEDNEGVKGGGSGHTITHGSVLGSRFAWEALRSPRPWAQLRQHECHVHVLGRRLYFVSTHGTIRSPPSSYLPSRSPTRSCRRRHHLRSRGGWVHREKMCFASWMRVRDHKIEIKNNLWGFSKNCRRDIGERLVLLCYDPWWSTT